MSVNMVLPEVHAQTASIKAMCSAQVESMEAVKKSIYGFILEPGLRGMTYDSAKKYFKDAYIPLANGIILLSEAIMKANEAFPEKYVTEVDTNSLYSDILEQQIQRLNYLAQSLENLQIANPLIDSTTQAMARNLRQLQLELQRKLEKLLTFNHTSVQVFSEIEAIYADVQKGLREVSSGKAWNAGTGTFLLSSLNLTWTKNINHTWEKREELINQQKIYDELPLEFKNLIDVNQYEVTDFALTSDGFIMCKIPLSVFMKELNRKDWEKYNEQYLYSVKSKDGYTFSTYKLRVGEEDKEESGVSVSFVHIDSQHIADFLSGKGGQEFIEMAIRGRASSRYLSAMADKDIIRYFKDAESEGSYLLADSYVRKIIEVSPSKETSRGETIYYNNNGGTPFEDSDYRDKLRDSEYKKLQDNLAYDKHGGNVIVSDKNNPTLDESNALLLTHSANIDKYSFSAEIKFHAEYAESMLEPIKNSAIKSDMGVGESKDYGRLVPFYSLGEERYKEEKGDLYLEQKEHH